MSSFSFAEDSSFLRSSIETSSSESFSISVVLGAADVEVSFAISDKSSFDTWIFSGIFLALLDGNIGWPLLETSPLYKFSKSSPTTSSSSELSSTCSTCFLNF